MDIAYLICRLNYKLSNNSKTSYQNATFFLSNPKELLVTGRNNIVN